MSAPVFLGHMFAQVHGVTWTTNAEVEKDKALAAQIFGGQPEDLWIGECHGQDWCLWVLAIQVVVGLMRGPKWRGLHMWHVYRQRRCCPTDKTPTVRKLCETVRRDNPLVLPSI